MLPSIFHFFSSNKSRLVLSIVFLFQSAYIFGQYHKMAFDHLTVEDGLSQSSVFSIAQDAEGFIWFGTRDGLNRFNSHEIKIYKNNPTDNQSLSSNTINSMLLDSRNRFWIGTYLGGVSIYKPETDNFLCFKNIPNNDSSLSNNNVNVVFEDREKNIWIGTRNGLNLVVSMNPFKVIRFYRNPNKYESLVDNYVRTIYQDNHGDIWVGTLNGISRLKFKRKYEYSFTNYVSSRENPNSLNNNWINTIIDGDNETIWIGTEKGGINIYNRQTNTFHSAKNPGNNPNYRHLIKNTDETVRTLIKDNGGNYWIGTLGGLLIYYPVLNEIKQYSSNSDNQSSLSDNSVRSIFMDRNGSFWLGTYYAGVNFYSPNSKQFDYFKQKGSNAPLRFKMASAIFEDFNSNLWLSIDGGGIIYRNKTKDSYEIFKHKADDQQTLSQNNVKCIYPDGKEGLWVGTFNGLNYLSFKTRKFKRYFHGGPNSIPNDRIYSITQDSKQDFWIATNGGGLCRYSKKDDSFETFKSSATSSSLLSDFLTCLLLDSKNTLWIGSSVGVCQRLPDGKFRRFDINLPGVKDLNGQFILAIYEDKEKRIWVGTRGKGLFKYDNERKDFIHVDNGAIIDGLNIYGILEDKNGLLWLSTENGISKFDPNKQEAINYNRKDGLICKEFNYNSYLKDRKGYMYFGGYNGVVIFHPDSIDFNSSIPPLAFTKLKLITTESKSGDVNGILQKSLNFSQSIKLKHNQNIFSIEFAVLNYINPGKNQYAYMLEGFEQKWNYVAEPIASYMNLPSGRYTLLVKGCNNDGVWNEKPISLTIHILPAPWKTWWAFTIYFGLILLALYGYTRFTKIRLRLEQKLFLEQMEHKQQNELNQSKLRFFTNISHEIRTPLTLIISPLDNLLSNSKVEHEIKKQLQLIDMNAKRLLKLINQLLDFRKHENGKLKLKVAEGNIVKFLNEITFFFKEYARIKKIDVAFVTPQEEIKLWYDRNELEKVFFNLLSNAFKFTPENGKIKVAVQTGEKSISIIIEDNGHGISKEHTDKIFDRYYQVENYGLADYGFGIGLALAKGIVELHKGEISVESNEAVNNKNGYTKFTVTLLKGKKQFSEDEIVTDYKTSEQIESYIDLETLEINPNFIVNSNANSGKNQYSILIADDNAEIRNYLADRLSVGYTIMEAQDGNEAWNLAVENVPNIIISDVVMPNVDGITLTSRLKSDERTSHIPVILLTARNTLADQFEGLETGADEYITKPFNIHVLELKIRNLLEAREHLKTKYSRIITLEPTQTQITSPEEKLLQRIMEIIEKHMADPDFSVPKLVEELSMSRPVLFRKLKALTDMSVIDMINTTRLKKAAALLKQKKMTIAEVSYAVGFTDAKYFSKSFRQQFGKTPTEYMSEEEDQL